MGCPAGQAGKADILTCSTQSKRIIQLPNPQLLFGSSVFCLFIKHPSQAVLFCLTKSGLLYCSLVFVCIKDQVYLEVWLYISEKTISELGFWCGEPTVAELSFMNIVLQSFIKQQMLWCFAVLRGSSLGNSMNSQVFKSLNYSKMRGFFFSGRKDVPIFRSMKRLELIKYEVLLACCNMLTSVSLWKMGQVI